MVEIGAPVWTSGQFTRRSALDDLGLESVGAGLLRRLIPGVLQTSGNAGYYSFYPYLLAKWEEVSDSTLRSDFKPFYRRQEAAYAVACVLHNHRGPVSGIQGSNKATEAERSSGDTINVGSLADHYMDSPYGGYGLFYARVLEEIRVTRLSTHKYVDRITPLGQPVVAGFAEEFEATTYYRDYFDADLVPRDVLEELGERACSCSIPGRADHQPLLDVFFGEPDDDPVWAARRQTRVESLSLFLEYHRQRPDDDSGDLRSFRTVLAERAFAGGLLFKTPYTEKLNSWRAYQLRECETLVLTALWSWYLRWLEQIEPTTHQALREELVARTAWEAVDLASDMSLATATEVVRRTTPNGAAIVAAAYEAAEDADEPTEPLARSVRALLAIGTAAGDEEPGFSELVDEGGPGRWSLSHLREWLELRQSRSASDVLGELLDELHHQHVRIALTKVSPTDTRDPFCFAEDDGVLRLLRTDLPFWTGARFEVANHLLWTLGLLDSPLGRARLTALGEDVLRKAYTSA